MNDPYVSKLEKEIEINNKLFGLLGDLIDEGACTSSLKYAHILFARMGEMLGLDMTDVAGVGEDDLYDDEWDDALAEDFDD